jgi:hypothetical protein
LVWLGALPELVGKKWGGLRHLKAWPVQEDLLLRWCVHMAGQAVLAVTTTKHITFPKVSRDWGGEGGREGERGRDQERKRDRERERMHIIA